MKRKGQGREVKVFIDVRENTHDYNDLDELVAYAFPSKSHREQNIRQW